MRDWGKVRERKRGGWFIDLRPLARIWTTPSGRRFASREHAEQVLEDIRRTVWQGGKTRDAAVSYYLSRTNPRLQLGYAYGLWIAKMREAEARGECSKSYVDHLARYAKDIAPIAATHYGSVTYGDLDDLNSALAPRLGAKSRHHVFSALHTFFRWMRRRGMIDSVPEFPVIPLEETEGPLLEPEQQRAVIDEIGERKAIFLALAYHGLRPSEACRLDTPADYDWKRGIARLPSKKAKAAGGLIPFSPELRELLEASLTPEQRIDGGPLFRNARGFREDRRWTVDALERTWRHACGRVGVECPLYRGTKHSSATAALRRGVPLDQIKAAFRHADIRSTEKYARAADLVPVEKLRGDR